MCVCACACVRECVFYFNFVTTPAPSLPTPCPPTHPPPHPTPPHPRLYLPPSPHLLECAFVMLFYATTHSSATSNCASPSSCRCHQSFVKASVLLLLLSSPVSSITPRPTPAPVTTINLRQTTAARRNQLVFHHTCSALLLRVRHAHAVPRRALLLHG